MAVSFFYNDLIIGLHILKALIINSRLFFESFVLLLHGGLSSRHGTCSSLHPTASLASRPDLDGNKVCV